ncbi:MAG: hypothetical protein AAGH90_02330 [Pseudomonadota bacterium]
MLKMLASGMAAAVLMTGVANANGPLSSTLEAYIVGTDDDGTETLTSTDEITPGETIEYVLVYENTGDTALSGLVVSAPIPASTTFIMGSDTQQTAAVFEVSADDGATWGEPPLMRVSEDGEEEILVSEYDMVRWVPTDAIDAGKTWQFKYRTSVE